MSVWPRCEYFHWYTPPKNIIAVEKLEKNGFWFWCNTCADTSMDWFQDAIKTVGCLWLVAVGLCVDHMPSSKNNRVLFDMAAQRIDPGCLGSNSSSPTGSNQVNGVLSCKYSRLLSKRKLCHLLWQPMRLSQLPVVISWVSFYIPLVQEF